MKCSMLNFEVCCFPAPFARLPKWDLKNGAKKRGRLTPFFSAPFSRQPLDKYKITPQLFPKS